MTENGCGCTTLENVGRERIGESLGSRVPFMQFSPLTPSNRGHHVRDTFYLHVERKRSDSSEDDPRN